MKRVSGEKACLLRISSPYFNESFLGYIVRLTEINYCERPSWILQRIGIYSSLVEQSRSFIFSKSPDVTPLCKLLDVRPAKLTQLFCPPADEHNPYNQILFGSSVPKRMIRPDNPKICPECLRASNYYRKIWDLALVTACPIHKCLLLDECPNCAKRISWTRKHVSICQCGCDWRTASSVLIGDAEVLLTQQIYQLCGLNPGHNVVEFSKSNPLLHLNLGDLLMAVVCMTAQYAGVNDVMGKYLTRYRKNREIHRALIKGLSAFENWPHQYFEFLDWKRKQGESEKLYPNMKKDFGGFTQLLRRALPSKSLDFMRIAFEEYLKTRWDGGLLFKKALCLTKDDYDQRKYVSQKEVERILRVAVDAIKGLVEAVLLTAIVHNKGQNKQYLFDRVEVEALKRQIEQLATTKDIARLLGVDTAIIDDLVQNRCIKTVDIFPGIRFKNWRFNIAEAGNLITVISGKIIERYSSKHDLISFNEAVMNIGQSGMGIGDFVRAILNGEICPCSKIKKKGLKQFLFDRKDIRKFSYKYRQNLKGTAIMIPEAARALGVKEETAYFFVAKGLISTQETRMGRLIITTTTEAIDRFNSTYVLAIKVASEVGTSTSLLNSCLKEIGVNPVSGRKIDKGKQYLYKRADLDGLDLGALILKGKLKRDPRGQMHTTIGSKQACEVLGIDKAKLIELVRGNQLQPYLLLSGKGEEQSYLFLRVAVEKYRDERTDLTNLVSSLEAAEMLGESYGSFCGKWVTTERLKPVKFKHILGKHYFPRKEIEGLIKFKKETIRSREAAAILKVGKVTIFEWTMAGKLRPISGPHIDGFGCNLYLRKDIEKLCGKQEEREAMISSYSSPQVKRSYQHESIQ